MRFLILFISIVASSVNALSQTQTEYTTQSTRDRLQSTTLNATNNATLFTIKGPAGKLLGDPYLDTTWQSGNVKFYNRLGVSLTTDSLASVPVRLDLSANEVEIKAGAKDIRAVKSTAIRYVDINNSSGSVSRFMNVREYEGEIDGLTGFFDQLVTGKLSLLLHPSVYVQKANFNVAMNTGTKDDELIKKMDWYVARGKQAAKFSPNKKTILELMADQKEPIETFLKSEKPNLKSRQGLQAVFMYYNKL